MLLVSKEQETTSLLLFAMKWFWYYCLLHILAI